jgi:D-lactate dehydrogenase
MALFDRDPAALAPRRPEPLPDRVPEALATGADRGLRSDLGRLVGDDNVFGKVSDLVRYATDASPYRLIPRIVASPENAAQVASVLFYAKREQLGVTFRSGGTSLSGQAQGDGILLDVRRHFQGGQVLEDGRKARLGPGTTLARANALLAPFGTCLGPDPASSVAATIGGVVANNASGMTCGVRWDSYHTLRGAVLVLASGTIVDTTASGADETFALAEPQVAAGLMELKARIEADTSLVGRIRTKHRLKNTNGYRLDAFLDGDTPVAILERLVVGSEGTLAFLAEATFDAVPVRPLRASALLFFSRLEDAAGCVPAFNEAGASALELMDATTIARVRRGGHERVFRDVGKDAHGLLVEFRASDIDELGTRQQAGEAILPGLELLAPASFTRDPKIADELWRVRSGILVTTGSRRPKGTSLILEDVCVPPDRLAEAVHEIEASLDRHGFGGAGVFGHAAAGNLHFLLTPSFNDERERARYGEFMEELVDLVTLRFDGSLKAEHGTGRNMSPFLAREWGPKATELMWATKRLLDPDMVLSPGVVLNSDPQAHMDHLHSSPQVEPQVDGCIECGYCDPSCPSRSLTTTPRQRIALRREMQRQPARAVVLAELLEAYEYDAIQTCAGDGSCALSCPIGIDTGSLMKAFRHLEHTPRSELVALTFARHWGFVERLARAALRAGHLAERTAGRPRFEALFVALRRLVSPELLPSWIEATPYPQAARLPTTHRSPAAAVYFPACVNRIFGSATGNERERTVIRALIEVSRRAGLPLWIPDDVAGLCCATVWRSKGFERANEFAANEILEAFWRWSDGGRLRIVTDASSCALGLSREITPYLTDSNRRRHENIEILDSITWAAHELLPRLQITRRVKRVVVHPTCSVHQLEEVDELMEIARRLGDEVLVPAGATCCGFAGDRGFLHPELAAAATAQLSAEVVPGAADAYLSSNRTCEIGLREATGARYESFLLLLEELTAAGAAAGRE